MNRKFIYIGCTVFAMSLFHAGGIQAQEDTPATYGGKEHLSSWMECPAVQVMYALRK